MVLRGQTYLRLAHGNHDTMSTAILSPSYPLRLISKNPDNGRCPSRSDGVDHKGEVGRSVDVTALAVDDDELLIEKASSQRDNTRMLVKQLVQ